MVSLAAIGGQPASEVAMPYPVPVQATAVCFDELLGLIEKHEVDLLSLHTRLVRDGYRGPARHAYGKQAGERR